MLPIWIVSAAAAAIPKTYATWDSAKKGSGVTLSGWNLVATVSVLAWWALSNIGKTTGKWYWEITVTDNTNRSFVGIGDASANLEAALGNDTHWRSYIDTGNTRYNNSDSAYGNTWAAPVNIGVAWDAGANTIAWYKNWVLQSGGSIASSLTGTQYAGWSCNLIGSCTANFGATSFTYSVPSGYNSGLYTQP